MLKKPEDAIFKIEFKTDAEDLLPLYDLYLDSNFNILNQDVWRGLVVSVSGFDVVDGGKYPIVKNSSGISYTLNTKCRLIDLGQW